MTSKATYKVTFQPWDGSWCLAGPVGANGKLLFQSAREAASHARWEAKNAGGTVRVFDAAGKLFKTIEIEAEDDPNVLPSSQP